MERTTIRLESEDARWLEMTVEDRRAIARVGGSKGEAEPFPFSFENLGYVVRGMGYQAWGGGSHFAFRSEPGGVAVEFQGPNDRSPAVLHMTMDAVRERLGRLETSPPAVSLR